MRRPSDSSTANRGVVTGASDSPLTAALIDYEEMVLAGAPPSIPDFCSRHPHLPELAERLACMQQLRDELASALRNGLGTAAPPQLPRYEIVRRLGAGGMGEVYLARQRDTMRLCALKILPRRSPMYLERFKREAVAAARCDSPNLCRVFEACADEHTPYIATEYVMGVSLERALELAPLISAEDVAGWFAELTRLLAEGISAPRGASGSLAPAVAIYIAVEVLNGLAAAHEHGVVHRDVKPSNVMLTMDGRVKLIDFGIASLRGEEDEHITQAGAFVGTVDYAAPEQVRGDADDIGVGVDIYAVGMLLFQMLTDHLPLAGLSLGERIAKQQQRQPRVKDLRRDISRSLSRAVGIALHPDRKNRFADAESFAAALQGRPFASGFWGADVARRWLRLRNWAPLLGMGVAVLIVIVALVARMRRIEARVAMLEAVRDAVARSVVLESLGRERGALSDCVSKHEHRVGRDLFAKRVVFDLALRVQGRRVVAVDSNWGGGAQLTEAETSCLRGLVMKTDLVADLGDEDVEVFVNSVTVVRRDAGR